MSARRRFSLSEIFVWPLLLAIVTGVGLVAALLGNDIWDVISWIALLSPIAVTGWALAHRRG